MTATKILCPTDFSAGSRQALRVAARIARATDAELVIVHDWYIPPSAYSPEVPFPDYLVPQVIGDAQAALDAEVKEAVAAGATRATGKLSMGVPWHQIVDELGAQAYELCVIGSQGRTGLARVLLGSVAERVVRHAPCSVLVVRPDSDAQPFRHALVPTDFSDTATHALDLAASLVERGGALTLLHVIELPVSYTGEIALAGLARDLDRRATETLTREVERVARATGLTVDARVRIGHPGAQTLATLDQDRSIDFVALGSRGRTGLARVLLGSVAEKTVRHARCAVLVARRGG